jgi:Fic family protein
MRGLNMSGYEKMVRLWHEWNVQSDLDIDLRLHNFRILFAYNSGKIENDDVDYHDTREIFLNSKVSNYTGDPRALFETQNQKLCYEFLNPKLAAREVLSIDLVKKVHEVMTAGTYDERRYIARGERPGEFKKHDYVTGRAEVGSLPENVERDMTELIDEITAFEDKDLMKAGAYFHARFEHIHPFADGNGRVGRTLLNYFLMVNNHPPLIIHEEDRRGYYNALERYDIHEELEPMRIYLLEQFEKTWRKTLEREQKRAKDLA